MGALAADIPGPRGNARDIAPDPLLVGSRMPRHLGFRVRLLSAVFLVLPLLAGCDEQKQAAAPPAKPAVGVRPAAMKGVNQSFEFVGRIKAVDKVDVRARVEGFLEKVLFREGQDVKVGDLLE